MDTGEIYFVGKDVCDALGYSNHNDAIRKHCRGVATHYPIVDSLGRVQEARVLSEADVFRLTMKSTLPGATKFESWVFEEVLPTIRRTGSYNLQKSADSQKSASSEIHELRKEIRRLSKAIESLNTQKITSSKTKVVTRTNTQIITRSEPYVRGSEKIQIVADAVQFEDFFVFGAVMDFVNQIANITSKHLSTILVDLGFEPRTRRRINGERQSIWARKGFKASDQWLVDNVTPTINALII